jgi:phospholipid/cholesterol/gamma-HCH transport system ATP-binding protein
VSERSAHIEVQGLTLAYGDFVILRTASFTVPRGAIFFIVGGSGSGKSTLLRALVGLLRPVEGLIAFDGESFLDASGDPKQQVLRRFGVTFQSGALVTSMTLGENVALPLEEFTPLGPAEIEEAVRFKLELVGLGGFEAFYPGELSGGMQKRAGLARAIALDPEILFFDEPSAGLDPVALRRLDQLILQLRDGMGSTVVIVSHELRSILGIGDLCIYLDSETRSIGAAGKPLELLDHPPNDRVAEFFDAARWAQGGELRG